MSTKCKKINEKIITTFMSMKWDCLFNRLHKISSLHSGKVLLKKFFKFQDNKILLENSKRFYVHQVETSKFLNKATYQSPRVWEMECYLYLCGWCGWRASVGRVLLWVAWVKCSSGWCERRATVGDVGGVPKWLRWLLC